MAKSTIDIVESLVGLSASTIFELRGEWRRLHRAPPPMRLSRDLLLRGIGAFADMNKAAIDVAQALVRLSELTIFELRGEWRRLHRMPPPMRFSRDLLTRGISYKLQERAYGGLSTATARKLEQAAADPLSRGAAKPAPPISLKPGTRLVREWRGVTHTVLIHADGIEWRGQRYHSLSVVARKITGARWSGPRFFGLRQRPLDSTSTARTGHGQG
jgi:hypothetical protein